MADDPSSLSPFERKIDELLNRLTSLEESVSLVARQVSLLEERTRTVPAGQSVSGPQEDRARGVPNPSIAPPASPAPPPVVTDPNSGIFVFPTIQPKPKTPRRPLDTRKLEQWFGGNWLLWVGITAIVLGIIYFLKLAFENDWTGPYGRVAVGTLFGAGFYFWGEELQKRRHPIYAQIATISASVILYLSSYAALQFYRLIPVTAGFLLMMLVTLVCGTLAARYKSLSLAYIGLAGGYLTPGWLLNSGDRPGVLLGYSAALILGVALLARRRSWMVLNYSGFLLTLYVFLTWARPFYSRDRRGITELFLCILAGLYLLIGREALHRLSKWRRTVAVWFTATAGVLFFLSSAANLFVHGEELLFFTLGFTAAAVFVAVRMRQWLVFDVAFVLSAVVQLLWLLIEYHGQAATEILILLTMFFVLNLAAQLFLVLRADRPSPGFDHVVAFGNGLVYFGSLFLLLEVHHQGSLGVIAAMLSVGYFFMFWRIRFQGRAGKGFSEAALGTALAFATLTISVQFTQSWITLLWTVQAVAMSWVAVKNSSLKMLYGAWGVMALVLGRLVWFDIRLADDNFRLILNGRFFTFLCVIIASYAMAWMLERAPQEMRRVTRRGYRLLILLSSLLTVVLMTLEASSFYEAKRVVLIRREALRDFNPGARFHGVDDARQLAYSILWGIYSVGLVVIGIIRRFRDIRLFAMALFALTIAKVFFVDLKSFEMAYRVFSMIGLGIVLLLAAYLYQHYRKLVVE